MNTRKLISLQLMILALLVNSTNCVFADNLQNNPAASKVNHGVNSSNNSAVQDFSSTAEISRQKTVPNLNTVVNQKNKNSDNQTRSAAIVAANLVYNQARSDAISALTAALASAKQQQKDSIDQANTLYQSSMATLKAAQQLADVSAVITTKKTTVKDMLKASEKINNINLKNAINVAEKAYSTAVSNALKNYKSAILDAKNNFRKTIEDVKYINNTATPAPVKN